MFWDLTLSGERECFNPRTPGSETSCDAFAMDTSFTEKETFCSPMKYEENDVFIFETQTLSSPPRSAFSCRRPLDDLDNNSQDSGYSASSKNSSPKSRGLSFGSCGSMDETFLDITELEQISEKPELPGDFNKLITGSLLSNGKLRESPKEVSQCGPIRRAFSLVDKSLNSSRPRCLFKENQENFKRPEPPAEGYSPNTRRTRTNLRSIKHVQAKSIYRSISAEGAEESIKSALQRDSTEPDLVGDFSRPFSLPLTPGKHQDLKSISSSTLAKLVRGEFDDRVGSFQVIDCRYPYEFEGGHIAGAKNLYTKQQIVEHLMNDKRNGQSGEGQNHKRDVLVFHCEFSSERGPNLSRYLRSIDRSHNMDHYPFLHYPEIYLLDGGYKNFFETHVELCTPRGYLPMLHPDHKHNLRIYRAQSKTFNADSKSKPGQSSSFKRL